MNNNKWNDTTINIVLLSHTDLDGHGSEIVLRGLGFDPKVYNLENHEVDSNIDQYVTDLLDRNKEAPDVLLITDIAPTTIVAEKLEELYKRDICEIYLFDHHKTALPLNQYDWAKVVIEEDGVKQCGTSLLYEFLIHEKNVDPSINTKTILDTLVEEIRLYDTWEWEELEHTSAKELNDLFYLIGHQAFIDSRLSRISNFDISLFNPDEEKLLDVENKRILSYLNSKEKAMIILDDFFTDDDGQPLVAGVVQADSYISELGHYLCDNYPEIDFALLLKLTENKVSMRAVKENVDLSTIAKKYHGGGHAQAAGCSLTEIGQEFLMEVYKKI